MYAPTSTNSPRSGPTSGDDDGLIDFDGAGEILRAWGNGLRPDPDLTVSEWADRHRMLSGRASAEPGRYRTVRTPYMREIMDRLSPGDPTQRIVFMKAAQVGATEAGNNWIGFAIHQAPGPMLAVQPTVELAKRNSRQRIDPLIDESPELRERVKPARSRDAGNTMLSKEFAGGILIMTGANSAVGLRSTPARYIFLDEVDAYPASADEEGDPVTLAEARSLTFAHRRKVLLVSTPTIRGLSRIEREYEASDQRRFFVPCPQCGHAQWLKFDRLRWQKGRPETAEYHCEGCDAAIAEHHKTAMLEGGEWRATATAADPTTVGYHLSALYSPIGWLSWERIVRSWEAAQGSDEAIKAFRNTILGETWVETGEAPDWQRLYDRRERWKSGTVPAGGLFLTAGADVQKDRIEVDVWAWGRGLESWLVDHVVIEGGPDRVSTIYDLAGRLNLERGFAEDLVKRGVSIDESRRLILDQVAAKSDETRNFPHVSVPLGGRDECITRRDAVANALLHRYSPTLFQLEDAARQYRGMTLLELARESLGNAGVNTRGLSRDEVATRALHSTSDFPEILSAVTNKTLRQAYEAYPRTFMLFCRQVLATDFKAMHRVQLGEAPQLLEVGESGEFKRGTLGESKESYKVKTYGRVVAITRQTLINDDLDAFTRIPAMYGNSIAQLESDVVWGIITANPAMADGNALFHTTHKNLAGTGAALDVSSVGAARAAMAKQTGLDKKTVLNVRPAFLIVPASLELKAEQLVAQNLVPAATSSVVPQSIRTLAPISEPRLDAASETAWYLAASPNQIDTIEYAYLEGQQGAYIETRNGFDVDGVEIKCRLDFGAKAIDWRGLYKNPGA